MRSALRALIDHALRLAEGALDRARIAHPHLRGNPDRRPDGALERVLRSGFFGPWDRPDIDGLEICRRIRRSGDSTPILMLTARDAVNDRVAGLDVGADDYLVKPFDLAELLARLRALLRRHNLVEGDGAVLRFEDLSLNPQTREVHRGARSVELTKIEFDLLELFLHHPRQVLTRDQILDLVWGYNFDSGTNSLAVYIGYLRRKLEEANEVRLIQTVRGVGYALRTT